MLPAFPWAVGAIALGQAVQVASGSLHPRAILLLSVTIACVLAGVLSTGAGLGRVAEPLMIVAIGAGLCLQLVNLALVPPAMYLDWGDLKGLRPFVAGVVVSAVLIGSLLAATPRLSRWLFPALLGVFLAMGVWLIRSSPNPLTDVYVVQRDSIAALLDGRNPYAITFPNIYGAGTPFYAPDMLADGRTRFGYVYAPLSLFLTLPGHLLGDFRYAQLGAMALSAALMAYAVPGRIALGAAVLFLFTPRAFFVLEQGWIEPFVICGLCAVVFCAVRRPKALPYAVVLFLSTKQYLLFALPALLLLLPRPWPSAKALLRAWSPAILIGLLVSAPLILIAPGAFWDSAVALQSAMPFRADSLSYPAWWVSRHGLPPPPKWLAFAAAGAAAALALWRCPRTPMGFAAAVALIFLALMAFNKHAFCNYYYFPLAALCCAIAVSQRAEPTSVRAGQGSLDETG
jgi:hypothetical protein